MNITKWYCMTNPKDSSYKEVHGTDFFCPSLPASKWLKIILLRWLKINFKNWFGCWNLTHLLIRQSWSFFLTKNKNSDPKMGAYCTPDIGCFFLFYKMQLHCCFYISAHTEATAMIIIWGHREYPLVQLEYKMDSGDISRIVLGVFSKMKIFNFCQIFRIGS